MSGRTHRHENNITATGYRLVSGTIETSTSIGLEIGGSNASLLVYNDGMVSGQTGIALLGSDAQLTNYGTVVGTSKVGVSLSGGGTITNDAGLIEGAKWGVVLDAGDTLINMYGAAVAGTSAKAGSGPAGMGGGGVDLGTGTLVNGGEIFGGGGGTGIGLVNGGAGGVGAEIVAAGSIENSGIIAGGYGGSSYQNGGDGGSGVDDRIANLKIDGFILGGMGGDTALGDAGNGGVGVSLLPGETLTNNGKLSGGYGGNAGTPNAKPGTGGSGVYVPVGADLINNSAIHGGGGGQGYTDGASDAASGAGVYLNGGTLVNEGQITGFLYKVGFDYAEYNRTNPLPPGVGVDVASGLFNNNDDAVVQDGVELQDGLVNNYNKIYGHQADYFGALQPTGNGGAGLIQSGGTFNNTYLISGGFGTPYKYEPGGAGVALYGGTLNNTGAIEAGRGAENPNLMYAFGGGNGANIFGGTLVNTGIIFGGIGRSLSAGVGAFLDGGTLIDSGRIFGGYQEEGGNRLLYPAVSFGSQASTLIIDPGNQFSGSSIGSPAIKGNANDTLILGGSDASGTMSYLGSFLDGFGVIGVSAGATWSLSQTNTLGPGTPLTDNGTLAVTGLLVLSSAATITAQGTLTNNGTIAALDQGSSAIGVDLLAGAEATNNGTISGSGYKGQAGAGIYITGGTLTNAGFVGGPPAPRPGTYTLGVKLVGGSLINSGTIAGLYQDGGTVSNTGTISGNYALAVSLLNIDGGVAVNLAAGILTNAGFIEGLYSSGGTVVNTGNIGGHESFYGSSAGLGVILSNGVLDNSGVVAGGGSESFGPGSDGVSVTGGTVVNSGTIFGGDGVEDSGGFGIYINGGTIINSGAINGGFERGSYVAFASVQFGRGGGTLVIDPGATFGNDIVGNGINDTLVLAPSGSDPVGTLSGLGSFVLGITNIDESIGADWIVSGNNMLGTATSLSIAGSLNIAGSLIATGLTILSDQGTLLAQGGSNIQLAGLTLTGGELLSSAGALIAIGSSPSDGFPGTVLVQAGATVAGYGTIAGPVEDNGNIIAQAGTLDLAGSVSGSGTIDIDQGATVSAAGALTGVKIMFATGGDGLGIADPADVTGQLRNFGSGDTIDLVNLTATSLSFLGNKLTIKNGKVVIGSLTFQGSYKTADFSLQSDGHGGTEVISAAAARDRLDWVRSDLPFSNFLMPL